MIKIYLLYNENNQAVLPAVEKVKKILSSNKIRIAESPFAQNKKAELSESRFLLYFASNENDLTNVKFKDDWNFFLNEIAWKRKTEGDIIFIADDNLDFKRVPYKLKDSGLLNFSETDNLIDLLLQYKIDFEAASASKITKGVDYDPKKSDTVNIVYSPRAATVVQPDRIETRVSVDDLLDKATKQTSSANKDENGCRDDHVYGGKNKNPHSKTDYKTSDKTNDSHKNFGSQQQKSKSSFEEIEKGNSHYGNNSKKANSGCGCLVALVVFVVVAASIVIPIIANIMAS